MKRLGLVVLLVGVVGCQRSLEEANQYREASAKTINENLPDGCTVKYLGNMDIGNHYEVMVPVIAIRCVNSDVVTTVDRRQDGKNQVAEVTVTIQEIEKRQSELDDKKRQLQNAMSKLTEEEKKALGLK